MYLLTGVQVCVMKNGHQSFHKQLCMTAHAAIGHHAAVVPQLSRIRPKCRMILVHGKQLRIRQKWYPTLRTKHLQTILSHRAKNGILEQTKSQKSPIKQEQEKNRGPGPVQQTKGTPSMHSEKIEEGATITSAEMRHARQQ